MAGWYVNEREGQFPLTANAMWLQCKYFSGVNIYLCRNIEEMFLQVSLRGYYYQAAMHFARLG